jgi:hypothetical protein
VPALTIIVFFLGMITLAFAVIVVETWWVVASVGCIHLVGSGVLMWLLIHQLGREEREADDDQGESLSTRQPPPAAGR